MSANFFKIVTHTDKELGKLLGLCAGFETRIWRKQQLVDYIFEYIPEFALSYSECTNLTASNMIRMFRNAVNNIYKSDKYKNRGEFGELILHAILREVYNTIPAISKIYYKDGPNETVKGFDAVHVISNDGELELWLGEVKFYSSISKAISDVVSEIQGHTKTDYLRSEFVAITNKIDEKWPHAEKLQMLLDPNTSLDDVFEKACIPVLLTYDSTTISKHDSYSAQYVSEIKEEFNKHYETFKNAFTEGLPLEVHLFLLPLKTKADLVACIDKKLKDLQQI